MPMTPEARRALSDTIRGLRASLVRHIHGAVDSQWLPTLPVDDLAPAARRGRERFEEHVAERARGSRRSPDAVRADAEKLAAATWLNRLVFLRIFEAHAPPNKRSARVVTGYKSSPAYTEFVGNYAGPLRLNETFGYDLLLRVVFDELALDLPGLFGPGIADLLPFPPVALNDLVERLNAPALESCWTDDTTPGWIYQYWNDPDREALDAKIADGGKIAPHEIASKTQMFTERYMVEWLLHNSLGPAWLGICRRNGWTADVDRDGVLSELDRRRGTWRGRRERGEVALDELMPLESDVERRWAYYVPQERPTVVSSSPGALDASVPDSIRGLRILDPACGSGHFLVIAFDLLVALYEEEARHRGVSWARRDIAAWILEDNLHGVDLDVRAVQIAAAALWAKARQVSVDVAPRRMNLVAADLGLSRLPADDPARRRLVEQIQTDTGMPPALVDAVWKALSDVDFLGTLLKVDKSVRGAIEDADINFFRPDARFRQGKLFGSAGAVVEEDARYGRVRITAETALARVQQRVEQFLGQHTGSDDLGLRLTGEQLAAGLRFLGLVQEGRYHLVVGNPPYQGTAKMADAKYVQTHYEMGKADLYAAFMVRALELCVPGGKTALLTMRNWMFIEQYEDLRASLLTEHDVCLIGDLDSGAFESISAAQVVVSTVMFVARRAKSDGTSVGMRAFDPNTVTQVGETSRKRAAVLAQSGRFEFRASVFDVVPGRPVVYWWDSLVLARYESSPQLGQVSPVFKGMSTQDNTRFIRVASEIAATDLFLSRQPPPAWPSSPWVPYIKGGAGGVWFEPLWFVARWGAGSLELRVWLEWYVESKPGGFFKNPEHYFRLGVAVTAIGSSFEARAHRFSSVFGHMGTSAFPEDIAGVLCNLNSTFARYIAQSLNPTVHFGVGDVERVPMLRPAGSELILRTLDRAFTEHESHREPSVEFKSPGLSPWTHAQEWAQEAVDRPAGTPVPPYVADAVPEPPTDHVSYALGIVLGRFDPCGNGVLDPSKADPMEAYADSAYADDAFLGQERSGLLFLDGATELDDLDAAPSQPLRDAWKAHGPAIDGTNDVRGLRAWLRTSFFAIHKKMYDNRPIHWPLSSSNRTFVAWVNIHRMGPQTLPAVLARAESCLGLLRGRAGDLRRDRDGADAAASKSAEKLVGAVQKQLVEIEKFVADLRALATKGPPASVLPREVDATYEPDLDDGVMINSSALWPILDPQWKDPKKWWTEVSKAEGRKDYDWSHLAARYWPSRVDEKCRKDPSLGVAHRCFWRYHPARAYAWELRLQDEVGPDFRIDERDAAACRDQFLIDEPGEAKKIRTKERKRRKKKYGTDTQAKLFGAPDDERDELDLVGEEALDADEGVDDASPPPGPNVIDLRPALASVVHLPAPAPRELPVHHAEPPVAAAAVPLTLPQWDPGRLRDAGTGSWAMPTSDAVGNALAVLAAILRTLGQPAPARVVRWAAAACLHPHLVPPLLVGAARREWSRVVGAQADPLPVDVHRFIAAQDRAWGEALRGLRARGLLLETDDGGTWAPGTALLSMSGIRWADGRAAIVLSVLGGIGIEEAVQALPEAVRGIYIVAA